MSNAGLSVRSAFTHIAIVTLLAAGVTSTALAADPIGETGRIRLWNTIDQDIIHRVNLRNQYADPVVVAFINTRNGGQSVQVRVTNVTRDGFSIFMEEPDGEAHAPEFASYLVMERGAHVLEDGRLVEAGRVRTATVHAGGQLFAGDPVRFTGAFTRSPAVLHSLNSYANDDFMASFVTRVRPHGFEVGLEAAESGATSPGEEVAFIALEHGAGHNAGARYQVGAGYDRAPDGVDDAAHAIALSGFDSAPDVIVSLYGANGTDGSWARGAGRWDASGQTVFAEEDQVRDAERAHADEWFAFAAFAANSTLRPAVGHQRWRLRLAADTRAAGGNWVVRDLRFCADARCARTLTGSPFDSGDAFGWTPVRNAFDGNGSTQWKTERTAAGQSYLGLDFGRRVTVAGIALDADRATYTPGAYYVEYFDEGTETWVVADYVAGPGDLTVPVTMRDRFPTGWRIRNATAAPTVQGSWALRDVAFCADAQCATPLTGAPFASEHTLDWAPASNAFDGDDETFWKTGGSLAREAYIGLMFGEITEIGGLYVHTDNVVYTPTDLLVEYYDAVSEEWVTADYLNRYRAQRRITRPVTLHDRVPLGWRLRNVTATSGVEGNWAIRDLAFCADVGCAQPLDGAVFDSGHALDWAPAERAFDLDDRTSWKTFTVAAGEAHVGMMFDEPTELGALYLLTDNVIYTPTAVHLEYLDAASGAWVIERTFDGFQATTDHTFVLR